MAALNNLKEINRLGVFYTVFQSSGHHPLMDNDFFLELGGLFPERRFFFSPCGHQILVANGCPPSKFEIP
jgi:hypothetical protein